MNVLDRLYALEHHGIKLGLQNIRTILEALGSPHDRWASIHIAGTNGKGSVTAMVERALRAAGHRTGRYTSPHLARIEERVAIEGRPIDSATFLAITAEVLSICDGLVRGGALAATPTFFEVTTAIAFEAFRRAEITVGVIEVGLGGRFDATNVLTPRVCAITSIALDHQRYLGSTIPEIAFEKAGIIKPGVPVVIGDLPAEAEAVVRTACRERGSPLTVAGARWLRANRLVDGRATISFDTTSTRYSDITLGLAGAHQVQNALIAAATVELAMAQGIAASSEDVASGLEDVEWPARLEWVTTERGRVLLDAAHNPAGAHALASYLQDSATGRLPMIIAIMKDKDIDGIIRPLVPMASAFIATETGSERSLGATELMKAIAVIAPDVPVVAHAHWKDALSEAFGRQRHIVVAGSIFLVGPLRATLVRDNGPRA